MIISTQTKESSRLLCGDDKAIQAIKNAGFDGYDFSMFRIKGNPVFGADRVKYLTELRQLADKIGIVCNQAHTPFPTRKPLESENSDYNSKIFEITVMAIEAAGILGAKNVIVHPVHHLHYTTHKKRLKEENMEFYRSLAPYAKKAGVKIALENMWQRSYMRHKIIDSACSNGDSFCDYLDTLADDCFTACLDLGHCGLCGHDAAEMIRQLGKERLTALHVHDNDYLHDSHVFPYAGEMDWDSITKALGEIGYIGDITFEADSTIKNIPPQLVPEYLKCLNAIGKILESKIENARK